MITDHCIRYIVLVTGSTENVKIDIEMDGLISRYNGADLNLSQIYTDKADYILGRISLYWF